MIGYLIFATAVALGIVCVSYDSFARPRGWPVGELLSADGGIAKIAALVTILWALLKSFLMFHWWSPLLVVAGGWVAAFTLTMVLKKHVQAVGIVGIIPALILTILYLSERRPCGMLLHRLFGP